MLLFISGMLNSCYLANDPASSTLIILTVRFLAFKMLNKYSRIAKGGRLLRRNKEKG